MGKPKMCSRWFQGTRVYGKTKKDNCLTTNALHELVGCIWKNWQDSQRLETTARLWGGFRHSGGGGGGKSSWHLWKLIHFKRDSLLSFTRSYSESYVLYRRWRIITSVKGTSFSTEGILFWILYFAGLKHNYLHSCMHTPSVRVCWCGWKVIE
jgi:hypothetical protein